MHISVGKGDVAMNITRVLSSSVSIYYILSIIQQIFQLITLFIFSVLTISSPAWIFCAPAFLVIGVLGAITFCLWAFGVIDIFPIGLKLLYISHNCYTIFALSSLHLEGSLSPFLLRSVPTSGCSYPATTLCLLSTDLFLTAASSSFD